MAASHQHTFLINIYVIAKRIFHIVRRVKTDRLEARLVVTGCVNGHNEEKLSPGETFQSGPYVFSCRFEIFILNYYQEFKVSLFATAESMKMVQFALNHCRVCTIIKKFCWDKNCNIQTTLSSVERVKMRWVLNLGQALVCTMEQSIFPDNDMSRMVLCSNASCQEIGETRNLI